MRDAPEKIDDFIEAGGEPSLVLGKRKRATKATPKSKGKGGSSRAGPSEEEDDSLAAKRRCLLLDRGPVGELPLHMACLYNKPDVAIGLIRQHMEHGIPVAETFTSVPEVALAERPTYTFEEGDYMGVGGGRPSPFEGETPLHIAVAQGSAQIVEALLSVPPTPM